MINGAYTEAWLRNFADRIAALAVQEVEWERDTFVALVEKYDREVATLTVELAEVTKSRDYLRVEVINLRDTRDALRDQLATAKREGANSVIAYLRSIGYASDGVVMHDIDRYLLREYPATPSGESENDQCACGDVAVRNWEGYAFCAKCCATPSPEAREVQLDIPVTEGFFDCNFVRITPADAKRIMELAKRSI
jgi:hypothetical protein